MEARKVIVSNPRPELGNVAEVPRVCGDKRQVERQRMRGDQPIKAVTAKWQRRIGRRIHIERQDGYAPSYTVEDLDLAAAYPMPIRGELQQRKSPTGKVRLHRTGWRGARVVDDPANRQDQRISIEQETH